MNFKDETEYLTGNQRKQEDYNKADKEHDHMKEHSPFTSCQEE
jgi:hypothetical protein